MYNVPKIFLKQSVTVEKETSKDKWQKPIYADPVVINYVRIDTRTNFTGTGNNKQKTKATTLFVYVEHQPAGFVINDSYLNAKVTENGTTYTVKDYNVLREPNNSKVWGYEVGLI
ncbi:putative minor capsid protein [Lactococcus sp.]|uniref:putative minor capsid protein n=1 Tax=Lactococcus sp. TaxID=44273 RepID=UPI0035B4DC11